MIEKYKSNVVELFTLLDLKDGNCERAHQIRTEMKANFCRMSDEEKDEINAVIGKMHKHKVDKGVYIAVVKS